MKLKRRILPFYQAIPKLLLFQFISSIGLALITWGVSSLSNLLIGLSGKAAVSSGDFGFIFTHWQGYVMILLVLVMVLCFIAVELNALILYCNKLIEGEKASYWQCIKGGFAALKKYLNLRGLVIVLYASVLSPVLGLGFSLSLTESFYIPKFIMSVVEANPLYLIGCIIVQIVLIAIAVIYCFILHGTLLGDKKMKEASVESRKMVRRNWKNLIFELLCFTVLMALIIVILVCVFAVIPFLIVKLIPMSQTLYLFFVCFFCLVGISVAGLLIAMSVSFLIMKLTMLYKKYGSEGEWSYQKKEKKKHPVMITAVILWLVVCILLSVLGAMYYDDTFGAPAKAGIVAHRAGGVEAPENTVKGIETACELGANGCEIDIQRTSDGYYVVNHDNDFERVAGVAKKPSEMTLAEVKELRVEGEPVPTLEEMLEACRDKTTLFVELKGETADEQMADDAVRIIKEMGMEDQAVLISLKYDILDYIEQKYPEMLTGYLAFFSFGNIENTPFDYLALEEEIATSSTISAVHNKGKKLMVWTVNDEEDLYKFLQSDADAIITDSVKLAGQTKDVLNARRPDEVIVDKLLDLVS